MENGINFVLKAITIRIQENIMEALWEKQIILNYEIVSTSNHRTSYTADEKDRFLTDFGNDSKYENLIEWNI
jgi:hypothetical protein